MAFHLAFHAKLFVTMLNKQLWWLVPTLLKPKISPSKVKREVILGLILPVLGLGLKLCAKTKPVWFSQHS